MFPQILKASETVTDQNGVVKKEEVKEKTKNKDSSRTDSVRRAEPKAVSKDSGTRPPPASKRKKDDAGNLNREEGVRRKKKKKQQQQQLVVEETKPTEYGLHWQTSETDRCPYRWSHLLGSCRDDIWFDDVDPDDIEATVGAEAAEVMRRKLGLHKANEPENVLVKERAFEG